jgi:hypothetical protein
MEKSLKPMSNIYGITVSKNYSDILEVCLNKNYKLFKKWFIVTQEDDIDTISLVRDLDLQNVELLFYPLDPNLHLNEHMARPIDGPSMKGGIKRFHNITPIFDKGGAIRHCQNQLSFLSTEDLVVIIDSDIILNDSIKDFLSECHLEDHSVYGCFRYDYPKISDFYSDKNMIPYNRQEKVDGFFQLYKYCPQYLYKKSYSAALCDVEFKFQFKNAFVLDRDHHVFHIGLTKKNWHGRKTRP